MARSGIDPYCFDPAGLRHQVDLLKPVLDAESPWAGATALETVAQVWAGVVSLNGDQRSDAEQNANSTAIQFVIRYHAGLDEVSALRYKAQFYDCLAIYDPDTTQRWLVIETRSKLGEQS